MLGNYFKIAFRNLWKNKGFTAINITGLSVAFCIGIFLFLTAYHHLSFDAFHKYKERIFQAYFFSNDPQAPERSGTMPLPLVPVLKDEYPEVEAAARILPGGTLVEYKGNYLDKSVIMTDPDFLKIFSFPMIRGNRETALDNLSNVVISRSLAETLFGSREALGKQIQLGGDGNRKTFMVTGILEDFPDNSSVQYDLLIRVENYAGYSANKDKWDSWMHAVFVKLAPGTDPAKLEAGLRSFTKKYLPESVESLERKGARPDQRGDIFALRLLPLSKIHFDTEIAGGISVSLVYTMLGIAFFILLIACINFVNLNIARSFTRAREVGVRKSMGALRKQLFLQICGESALICLTGFFAGALLAYLLLPEYNALFRAKLDAGQLFRPGFLVFMAGVFMLVTLAAGGYPAWQMSKFNPVEVLKGKIMLKRPGVLRSSLIVMQFAMSSLLICCSITAVQQVDYLRERPLGFQKEQVISIPVGGRDNGRQVLGRMRNMLADDPNVLSITGTGVNLGRGRDGVSSRSEMGFTYKNREVKTDWLLIDYDYLQTLGIELLAGRDFNSAYPADSANRVIITESMAKMLGEKNPVGKAFQPDEGGALYHIVGMVPDFHLYSLENRLQPITMHLSHDEPIAYVFVRVSPQGLVSSMAKLEKVWKEAAPRSEFLASFLDENVDAWYNDEERLSQVFSFASGIAILLSCLGLFAVALMAIQQRTKEIGVRKVLGAGVPGIILVLSRDFLKMVFIALLIAIPLAWYFMQKWLNNYPYRVEMNIWVFILVGIAVILVALATVSFQSIKAAMMNPVKSLRSD